MKSSFFVDFRANLTFWDARAKDSPSFTNFILIENSHVKLRRAIISTSTFVNSGRPFSSFFCFNQFIIPIFHFFCRRPYLLKKFPLLRGRKNESFFLDKLFFVFISSNPILRYLFSLIWRRPIFRKSLIQTSFLYS